MAQAPISVAEAVDRLGDTPAVDDIYLATLPFNPHDIAAAGTMVDTIIMVVMSGPGH